MKTSVVRIFAGSGIRLAVLSVLLLGMAGVCMAQASAAPAQPAASAAVAQQAHPAAQPAQTAAPGEPAAKGTREGIKVHGHWTIEVRNPDGTLATRREFENSLWQGAAGGAVLLSALLDGTVTPGGWIVVLGVPNTESNLIFYQPNSGASGFCTAGTTTSGVTACSSNLSVVGAQYSSTNLLGLTGTLTLMGTATVPQGFPSPIGFVSTNIATCFNTVSSTTYSPQTCFNSAAYAVTSFLIFTSRFMDGAGGDPAAVPVTAGQTVAVAVVISFQ